MRIVCECSLLQQVLSKHEVIPISLVYCDDDEFENMWLEARSMPDCTSKDNQWFSVAGITFYRGDV